MISLLIALLISQAHAIENLPCQRVLEPSKLKLAENQIALRGKLEAFWETGMEDQTGWAILDDQTYNWLSRNTYDALYFLRPGDTVIIYDKHGVEVVRGNYDEGHIARKVMVQGKEYPTNPNMPMLKNESGTEVMEPGQFAKFFIDGNRALVIRALEPQELTELNAKYSLWLTAHEHFKAKRMVPVGQGQVFEAAYFHSVGRGELKVSEQGIVELHWAKGVSPLHMNDHVFVEAAGKITKLEIKNYPFRASDELRELLAKEHKVTVIR